MKSFVLLLFFLKALPSIRTTESSDQYNITKALNDTIVEIFQTVQPQHGISQVINYVANSDPVDLAATPYKYNVTLETGVQTEIKYYNLQTIIESSTYTYLSYGFLDNNKIELYCPHFIVKLSGKMELEFDRYYDTYDFSSVMDFTEFTLIAVRQSSDANSFFIDFKYYDVKFEIESPCIKLRPSLWKNMEGTLRYMLRTHMNRNVKLSQALGKIHVDQPKKFPHLMKDENRFYFTIGNIADGSINSRDIVIRGLWNFYSLNFTMGQDNVVSYTLVIKDIRGSMILYDEYSTLELKFKVDSLSISVTDKYNQIRVKAERYRIIETKLHTNLTEIQSNITMLQIEWAIGTSIMPSIDFMNWRHERPITYWYELEMKTCNLHVLKEITKLYDETRTTTTTKKPRKNDTSSDSIKTTTSIPTGATITPNTYHYHISFPETNINLLSKNPIKYPDQVQCELPANSTFTRRIIIDPSKTNHTDPIEIYFHFNYPSINVSHTKLNNSEANSPCEFHIGNNQDIKIELPPSPNNPTDSNGQLEVKKKIDATLMSMMKDRIVRIIKPAVCLPFEVCKQTTQMLDDFFTGFVNLVMKKVWF